MITTFDIQGFKSVKNVHLDCRRINLFIGEPNTGKSNILEALGFLSWCGHGGDLRDYVRLDKAQDLFYDGLLEKDSWQLNLKFEPSPKGELLNAPSDQGPRLAIKAKYQTGGYEFFIGSTSVTTGPHAFATLEIQGTTRLQVVQGALSFVDFYRFKTLQEYPILQGGSLLPPDGRNMVALVVESKELRQLADGFFRPYGLRFLVERHENKFKVVKESEGIAFSSPYHLTSDTLQRIVFYTIAIESNKDSTLVFEEPEAHAFPYFTKHLGERIALDENKNQYFIATHNPYLLSAVVEKAPAADVAVFATYYRDYETRVKLLDKAALSHLFESDPFLGIDQFTEEEA